MTFRQRALVSLYAALGMIVLPAVYWALDDYGPSSRVVVYQYLFSPRVVATVIAGALVGVSIGAGFWALLRGRGSDYSVPRVACGCLGGGALALVPAGVAAGAIHPQAMPFTPLVMATFLAIVALGGWLGGALLFKVAGAPTSRRGPPWKRLAALAAVSAAILQSQLGAFPAEGSPLEREAWARAKVPDYPGLAQIVAGVPDVARDIGRVVTIAPTAHDPHAYGFDMDGNRMRFTLYVIGEGGAGVFVADGTIACLPAGGCQVVDWPMGSWTFEGKTTSVDPRGPVSARAVAPSTRQ